MQNTTLAIRKTFDAAEESFNFSVIMCLSPKWAFLLCATEEGKVKFERNFVGNSFKFIVFHAKVLRKWVFLGWTSFGLHYFLHLWIGKYSTTCICNFGPKLIMSFDFDSVKAKSLRVACLDGCCDCCYCVQVSWDFVNGRRT